MLNLRTAAKKRVNSYFATPKSMYEKFVNKKWDERAKIHASKQDFIKVTISEWKSLSEQERIQFLSKKAPERPREKTVLDFFRKKTLISHHLSKIINLMKILHVHPEVQHPRIFVYQMQEKRIVLVGKPFS